MKMSRFFPMILIGAVLFTLSCIQMKTGLIINGKMSSPLLIENFEGMAVGDKAEPKGTEVLYLKGTLLPSDGWGVSQGTGAANKWVQSIASEGHNSQKSIRYDWNNKNGMFLNAALWFWEPVVWKKAEEFSFWIKSEKPQKFDIALTLVDSKGKQVSFASATPSVGGDNEWKPVRLSLKKFNVPAWYIEEQGKPSMTKIPKSPSVISINIAPTWNSEGICLIDDLMYGPKTVQEVPMKMKQRKEWKDSTSFVCYYGPGSVPEMSQADVAIVDGRNLSTDNIKELQASGTWVVSYVTIGEDDTLSVADGKGPGGYASYFMDTDGDKKPDKNTSWNSYFVDAGNPLWQERILNGRIKDIIEKFGCDGIFLDTVDTVDLYKDTKAGMVDLIRKMREKYPNIKIVQNRGFSVLGETFQYIDAIMFEDFSINYDWKNDSYSQADKGKLYATGLQALEINGHRKKKDFLVFDLGYADLNQPDLIQFCYDRAWEYDFIPYVANIQLDEVYPIYTPKSERGVKKYTGEGGTPIMAGDPARLAVMTNYKMIKQRANPLNFAWAGNKATIKCDSVFADYDAIHAIDGYTNDSRIEWNHIAWASLELPVEHWLDIEMDTQHKVNKVVIYWALDGGVYFTSQEVVVEYMFQGHWKELGRIKNTEGISKSELIIKTPEIAKEIRIFQPAGMGLRTRPNIMWISEVEVY